MQLRPQDILESVRHLIDARDLAGLASCLDALHPADIAEVLERLEPEERELVLGRLDRQGEAEVFEHVDDTVRSEMVEEMDDERVSGIVEEMAPEDAADLLGELSEERAEHVLELMAPPEAEEVEDLLRYAPDTAGGIMAPAVVRVRDDVSVADVLAEIRSQQEMHEDDIYNIYVVDGGGRVVGVVPLWNLMRAVPDTPVREIMEAVQAIPAGMDQEKVAAMFAKYDLATAPVVDRDGRLLGRITFDDVQDVVEEEASEDFSKFVGTDDDELASSSAIKTARLRLPWLLICLAGTFVSGSVISHFGGTLRAHIILMVFVPAVMATAGNSGLQTATMTVRSLATGQADRVGPMALILKQLKASVLIAVVCGVLAGAVGVVWSHHSRHQPALSPRHGVSAPAVSDDDPARRGLLLGTIIGGAMFAAICLSCTLGVLVPLTFRKVGIDPAVASGPLITTSSDIFSLIVYLGVATTLLVEAHA